MGEASGARRRARRVVTRRQTVLLFVGIAAFCAIAFLPSSLQQFVREKTDFGNRPALAAATAVLMAWLWITESLSIYVTACIPLVLFPLLAPGGKGPFAELGDAVFPYFNAYNFLFLGGMGIAAAMQEWGLHSRVALRILKATGTQPSRVLLGMLLATASVSLWISNTATAAMMLPIGLALIQQIERQSGGERRIYFGGALMLAIAYGANIGGMGTKIGTGPNLIFCGYAARELRREISFLEFVSLGLPFVVVFIPIAWWALWRMGRRDAPVSRIGAEVIDASLRALGPVSRGEKVVLVVFLCTSTLWILSQPIHAALEPLWKRRFDLKLLSSHVEASVAMLAMLTLLLIPIGRSGGRGPMALNVRNFRLIPWETLVLLGGGLSLATAVESSGLAIWMAEQLAAFRGAPLFSQFVVVSLFTVGFGAIASNVATTTVMLPVLKSIAGADALPLMVTATLAASCDFALPAGTPPNAIVFGSGYLTIPRMARVGALLDVIAALLLSVWGYTGVRWILGA